MHKPLQFLGRAALAMLVLFALLAGAGAIYQASAETRDSQTYPPPGQLVDVGGYRLHLHCTGMSAPGGPTVILDTMAGGSLVNWAWMQPEIAKTVRACSYDRAGYGWSDASSKAHDLRQAVNDLHTLLTRAGIAGPYVLVGHSMGGLIIRQFAAEHPAEVAGVVLVDASHPDQFVRHPEYLEEGNRMAGLVQAAPLLARFGLMRLYIQSDGFDFGELPPHARAELAALWSAPKHWATQSAGMTSLESFYGQAQGLGNLGEMPLAVVTAGKNGSAGWDALQDELATLSTNSTHTTIADATHTSLAFNPSHAKQVSAIVLATAMRAQSQTVLR